MTIGVNNRNDADGNGAAETYPYGFKIFAATDLEVKVRDAAGAETLLTYLTHYTVTNVGIKAGGNVVLVNGAFAWLDGDGDLKSGYHITIRRVRPLSQTSDIRNQGGFFADVHEDTFDHLIMVDQQQQDELDRSIKLPTTEDGSEGMTAIPALALRKGSVLGFDPITGAPTLFPTASATSVLATIVQFIAAGVSAVYRSVQDKLRDTYHIKDYGAVCDGVADDTSAIAAAVTAAGSGTLRWSGTPLVSAKITITQGRHVFDGRVGINSSFRPGSYVIKKSTLNDYALDITGAARLKGGGVVAEEGNGSSNIRISANSARWSDGYSENAGAHGWFIDGAANNANHVTLDHCRSYGNTTHGFYLTGTDANAGTYLNCFAQTNGGDGFFSEKTEAGVNPSWNTFLGCAAETNTGYGIRLKGGTDNAIIGGDYEANTTADIFIDATEQYTTLINQNRGSVITDNGFYTRRVDRYRDKRGTFHAALRGAGGATLTATAVTISGATATITSAAHGLANGQTIFHQNFSNANLNGAFPISNVQTNTYDITFRTDASATAPVNQTGLSVTIQRCGTLTVARGDYVVEGGVCEAWGTITTSAVTNITGSVQIILPFDGSAIDTNHNAIVSVDYHSGITYTGRLAGLLIQSVATRQAQLYDTISGTPGVPAQLQGTGLAATSTVVFHARYRMADSH